MTIFHLSDHSLSNLEGVKPQLVAIVKYAIMITRVDFGVVEGLRSIERQRELVRTGASETMASKHLDGRAVDLMAYVEGKASWKLPVYDDIAEAMKTSAIHHNVAVRWGGAWTVPDIRLWNGSMERAMNSYIDQRRKEGRRPFIDAPHFELA